MFTQSARKVSTVDLKMLTINFAIFTDNGADVPYSCHTLSTETFIAVPIEFHFFSFVMYCKPATIMYVLALYLDYSVK